MKVTKKVIAKFIAENTILDANESSELVDKVLEFIKEQVASGDGAEIRGFGSMFVEVSNRAIVRNIFKNEQMVIPPSKRLKFRASKDLLNMCKKQS
jgi:nucleoid DNA-binding protein